MSRVSDQVRLIRREFVHSDWSTNLDPRAVESSGLLPLPRAECAACHTDRALPGGTSSQRTVAGESCSQCHNDHVGRFPPGE